MDYKQFLKGKEITLLGLGLLGRGVGDAMFLAKYCKKLTITDLKTRFEEIRKRTSCRMTDGLAYLSINRIDHLDSFLTK